MIPPPVDPAFRDGLYVGRTKEAERIQSELEAGHNLVLTGPFGIGRTTLLRHLARELKPTWRFVFLDGSQTPGSLCERLLDVWAPERPKALRKRTHPWTVERRLLPGLLDREPRAVAVVLDDLGKVTHPKLDFLRWLQDLGRVRIIVVTERFLDEGPLMHLRAVLYPAPLLTLGPLSNRPAQAFFEGWAQLHGLDWEPAAIHGLVLATRGYPTGMWEAAQGATALSPPRDRPVNAVAHPGPIPESEG